MPASAVMAVLINGDRILMIRRGPAVRRAGFWSPPGGMIEPGESQRDAVVRELQEELGLQAAAVRKVWECLTDDGRIRLHWWLVKAPIATLKPVTDEVAETRWITAQEFAELSPRFMAHAPFFLEVLPRLITTARPTGS